MRLFLVLIAIAASTPSAAQTVTDGDTIKVGSVVYRLWGIDAPELQQICPDGWAAGRNAAAVLQTLIGRATVSCVDRGKDRYGRTIALCSAGERDLSAAMVSAGYAWAFTRYSGDYTRQESLARSLGVGVHAHGCEPAWEWRQRKRNAAQPTP